MPRNILHHFIFEKVNFDFSDFLHVRRTDFTRFALQLRDMKQELSESIDTYVTKLKIQAQKCNFANQERLEDELIDQIVKGTAHEQVRRKLLNQEPNKLTLDTVIDFARTFEATQAQMQTFSGSATEKTIAEVRKQNSRSKSRNRSKTNKDNCMFCGGQRHARDKCPARDEECNKCKKIGHWGKVCLTSKQSNRGNSSSRGRPRGRGGNHSGRSRRRSKPPDGRKTMNEVTNDHTEAEDTFEYI